MNHNPSQELQDLWKRYNVSTQKPDMAGFVEKLTSLLHVFPVINGDVSQNVILFNIDNEVITFELPPYRAKGLIRAMIVRLLALACRHGADRNASPYGGNVQAELGDVSKTNHFAFSFTYNNTPSKHHFRLSRI